MRRNGFQSFKNMDTSTDTFGKKDLHGLCILNFNESGVIDKPTIWAVKLTTNNFEPDSDSWVNVKPIENVVGQSYFRWDAWYLPIQGGRDANAELHLRYLLTRFCQDMLSGNKDYETLRKHPTVIKVGGIYYRVGYETDLHKSTVAYNIASKTNLVKVVAPTADVDKMDIEWFIVYNPKPGTFGDDVEVAKCTTMMDQLNGISKYVPEGYEIVIKRT